MLYYIVCMMICYGLAHYLNRRFRSWLTVIWSSIIVTIVGLIVGSFLVVGGLNLFNISLNHEAMPRVFGQAVLWSLLGTVVGIYRGQRLFL